jgi:predicted ribosomally synthesized peptide with nif11-like leader
MSTQSVKQFWKQIESDAVLQKKVEELFQQVEDQPVAKAEEVVRLGKQHGFEFTSEDLKDYLVTNGRDAQLSETDLANVAGGALNAYVKVESSWKMDSSLSSFAMKTGTILF